VRYLEAQEEVWSASEFFGLVGVSTAMRRLFQRLSRISPTDLPVMVVGETGVGKERVVDAIREASPRRDGPLVVIDCGSMPEHLLEAELFGYRRGSFTGATQDRVGAIEAANGGTLFLDEIGELPLSMQPKLLRVLETRSIKRLGENQYRPVDARVVCATHRDLSALVNAGSFREDLYFRLAVAVVKVPPLRERLDDIPLLLETFAPSLAKGAAADALLARMRGRAWLGNVRELKHYVERARVLGPDEAADSPDFAAPPAVGSVPLPEVPLDRPLKLIRDEWLQHLELVYVRGMMKVHEGNVSAVARAAGLDRSYVHRLIKKHRLGPANV
jgi:DNA-binding NtrC family response regulator